MHTREKIIRPFEYILKCNVKYKDVCLYKYLEYDKESEDYFYEDSQIILYSATECFEMSTINVVFKKRKKVSDLLWIDDYGDIGLEKALSDILGFEFLYEGKLYQGCFIARRTTYPSYLLRYTKKTYDGLEYLDPFVFILDDFEEQTIINMVNKILSQDKVLIEHFFYKK